MVWYHVAQRAGRVVELAAPLHAERLRDRDLDVIDMVSIPQWFEHAIGEAKHQNVLNGFLSEIVVDAIDLVLGQHAEDVAIERLGRRKIATERLLDDDPPPMPFFFANEAGVSQPLHNRTEHLRGSCQIEQVIATATMRPVGFGEKLRQILVGRRVIELAREMIEPLGKPVQVVVHHIAVAGFAQADAEIATERLLIDGVPRHADHGELLRQQPRAPKIVKSRE